MAAPKTQASRLRVQEASNERRRLSVTEAGMYTRVILQQLPKHCTALANIISETPAVLTALGADRCAHIVDNIDAIRRGIYEQLKLVNPEVRAPLPLDVDKSDMDALITMLQMGVNTLSRHIETLTEEMKPEALEAKKGLDWSKIENPAVCMEVAKKMKDNVHILLEERSLIPGDIQDALSLEN